MGNCEYLKGCPTIKTLEKISEDEAMAHRMRITSTPTLVFLKETYCHNEEKCKECPTYFQRKTLEKQK